MRKGRAIRCLTAFVLSMMLVCSLSVTAFAGAADTDQELPPVTEPSETVPETTPEPEPTQPEIVAGEGFTEDGNVATRDLLYDKATNKQFITIQSKNGNTFYIVIDYDKCIDEEEELYQTYFLNLVDERDLTDLMDDNELAAISCNCTEKCEPGKINTSCPVCKTNMSECSGKVVETEQPTEEPPAEPEPEKKSGANIGLMIAVFAIVGAGGAAYYYFKFIKGKKQEDDDLDFFDDDGYEEEPYINEDEEPQIAEDAETEDDVE